MPKIVVSYRRDDSAGVSGRLYDRLHLSFGRNAVFRDIDSIPAGYDFRSYIDDMLRDADVLLCVMSSNWIGKGRRTGSRIMDPGDFVRVEVETAMQRDIPIVPILVDETTIPSEQELPPSLHA